MITEDRRGTGILGCLSIADNVSISSLDQYLHYGIKLNKKKIEQLVKDNVAKLSIKTPSSKTLIQSLSGGNQQKVLISRWLANNPDVLILDEPTAVLTVQEIEKLFAVLRRMRDEGHSIIIITHKLNEVMELSDRVAILRKGEYITTVDTAHTNEQELTEWMVGRKIDLNIERPVVAKNPAAGTSGI